MHPDHPRYPVSRLVAVRVAQSTVGVLLTLIGSAGLTVVAIAMLLSGVLLGLGGIGAWTDGYRHAVVTGVTLGLATAGHTLAVTEAPVATVETIVQGGVLVSLAINPVARRRPIVIVLTFSCVALAGSLVGFAGGSAAGLMLAATASVAAAMLVVRLEQRPPGLSPGRYQAVAITTGGALLLPFGILLSTEAWSSETLIVLLALTGIFAITNLELARVVPATGAVLATASTGLRPVVALLLGAAALAQPFTLAAFAAGMAYVAVLTALARAVKPTVPPPNVPAPGIPPRIVDGTGS